MKYVKISIAKIKREKGIVILPKREYEKLLEQTIPPHYLASRKETGMKQKNKLRAD